MAASPLWLPSPCPFCPSPLAQPAAPWRPPAWACVLGAGCSLAGAAPPCQTLSAWLFGEAAHPLAWPASVFLCTYSSLQQPCAGDPCVPISVPMAHSRQCRMGKWGLILCSARDTLRWASPAHHPLLCPPPPVCWTCLSRTCSQPPRPSNGPARAWQASAPSRPHHLQTPHSSPSLP